MDWSRLLDLDRLWNPGYQADPRRPAYDQDADRISFSAPFRRLANKTQVHPLYDNDHIHHRLIHSVETASVGRSLGLDVGWWLEQEGKVEKGGQAAVAGLVHAACLAHDIGNPPFGHSGEDAIGAWFAEKFDRGEGLFSDHEGCFAAEFEAFEGNAQGFRILNSLEMNRRGGMRLTHGTLGAFIKYPVTAATRNTLGARESGLKKFGVFETERSALEEVASRTGMIAGDQSGTWWRRHPLVFLVEAADDICYNILDLEDAFTARDLAYGDVAPLLSEVAGFSPREDRGDTAEEKIALLRAVAIGRAFESCSAAFAANHDTIMEGRFRGGLIEASALAGPFAEIGRLASERIFTSPRKTELEVMGRNLVHRVLDGVLPVFEALEAAEWDESRLTGYPSQLRRALGIDLRTAKDRYGALHTLADYVSGMTDRYAVKVAGIIRA
ncbi:dGTP triphosphohydrolase [Martelella endophytica]|uniref:Deoxyguanosinetriphosphate triphosphohydrolase n=1 Tax=Martelella endophytica TaxID=1486262 RepID=A0A0D5LWV4_MAREN|nr:dNTP triphosphohydrolase [Martelella endophytica]AJY48297.1 deoxyguanosinetriphosphate triphosphohydrolase [Martelella endophytica]